MKEQGCSGEHQAVAERPFLPEFEVATRPREVAPEGFPQLIGLFSAQHFSVPLLPLIGREQQVESICALLERSDVRLLTLFGPGGVGKTSLALKVALECASAFDDGMYFVSLALSHTLDEVIPTIARSFSVTDKQEDLLFTQIQAVMQNKRFLLLLDNFEQVVDAAPQLRRLLAICPHLKIMVTSQTVLDMLEEHPFYVAPLPLPHLAHLPSCDELAKIPSISLFLQRARTVRPDFALTPNNAHTIAQICVRLNGLPLALELAAARLKLFSPQELLARLDDPLAVLTGGPRGAPERQQTLRKTVERSYHLLTADEQRLFRRLPVFNGGCKFQAIEAVSKVAGRDSEPLLDATTSLLDQSLIQTESEGGTEDQRFTMLSTLREYALELLVSCGEEEIARQAHAEYYLELANSLEHRVLEGESRDWVDLIERESENLRAAFSWFMSSRDIERALSMSGALWPFWLQSSIIEGCTWIRQALDRCADSATPVQPDTKARALHTAAMLEYYKGNWAHADALADEALQLFRMTGNAHSIAKTLVKQGIGALLRGRYAAAAAAAEESIEVLQTTRDVWLSTEAYLVLAHSRYLQGDGAQAYKLGKKCFSLGQQSGELNMMMRSIYALALFARSQGYSAEVDKMYEVALSVTRATTRTLACSPIAVCLIGLGGVVALQKQYARAAHLWSWARVLYKRRDGLSELEPHDWLETVLKTHLLHSEAIDAVRARLGEQGFIAAWNEGQSMALEELLANADAQSRHATTSTQVRVSPPFANEFTPREREVLQLLAQGLSNALIAERLVIGLTTVNSHVRSIYGKLGVSSRSAATRYAVEHGLA